MSWQHIKKPSFSGIILNWASRVLIYRVLRTKATFLSSLLLGKLKRKSMAHRPDLHLRLRKRKGAPSAPSMSPSRVIPVKTSPTFCLLRPMKKVQLINHGELTILLSPWFLGTCLASSLEVNKMLPYFSELSGYLELEGTRWLLVPERLPIFKCFVENTKLTSSKCLT